MRKAAVEAAVPLIETTPEPSFSIAPARSPFSSGTVLASVRVFEAERDACSGMAERPRTAASADPATRSDTATRRPAASAAEAKRRCADHESHGQRIQPDEPGLIAVCAGEDAVSGGEEPDGERGVVHAAPDAVREPGAEAVRDPDRDEELDRDDPEAGRERTIRGRERNDELRQRERNDGVERDRADVDRDEEAREKPEEAVHVLDGKPREAGHAPLAGEGDPGEDARGDEEVGDDAAGAGRVPDGRRTTRSRARDRLSALGPAGGEDGLASAASGIVPPALAARATQARPRRGGRRLSRPRLPRGRSRRTR